jgi:hypothetical protein
MMAIISFLWIFLRFAPMNWLAILAAATATLSYFTDDIIEFLQDCKFKVAKLMRSLMKLFNNT